MHIGSASTKLPTMLLLSRFGMNQLKYQRPVGDSVIFSMASSSGSDEPLPTLMPEHNGAQHALIDLDVTRDVLTHVLTPIRVSESAVDLDDGCVALIDFLDLFIAHVSTIMLSGTHVKRKISL